MLSWKSLAALTLATVAAGPALAQRGTDPSVEKRLRARGGDAAVQGDREQPTEAAYWAQALQHPEASTRSRAMDTLYRLASRGEKLEEAIPALTRCMNRQVPFPSPHETDNHQKTAMRALALARPDVVAGPLANYLAGLSGPPLSTHSFALDLLAEINEVSVNIDAQLLRALQWADQRRSPDFRSYEGTLLCCYAKLARDREQAGRVVLSRMHWPFRRDAGGRLGYTADHFKAVRLRARECGELMPRLSVAYGAGVERDQVLAMIAALAVYHDDAWEFFAERMQDRLTGSRGWMLGAYAATWLLAPEATRQDSLQRLGDLSASVPDWWRLTYTGRVSLLAPRYREPEVLKTFREQTGFVPGPGRPPAGAR